MLTILTVEPLSGNNVLFAGLGGTMKHNFGGAGLPCWAWEGATTRPWLGRPSGVQVRRVKYPANLSRHSITDGVRALRQKLRETTGDILVFGHSQGAQVISRLLHEGVGDDPGRVEFLLIGNPLRKYGGYGVGRPEVDGRTGLPTPTDSGYRVCDVRVQYDGWADWPDRDVRAAVRNANKDRVGINGRKAIHCFGYRDARLDDPERRVYVEGGTEYVLLPHAPLLPRLGVDEIESGYRRPETEPPGT